MTCAAPPVAPWWTSLFAKPKKSKALRTTSTKLAGLNQAHLQLESLEERRPPTANINVAVVDMASDNSGSHGS